MFGLPSRRAALVVGLPLTLTLGLAGLVAANPAAVAKLAPIVRLVTRHAPEAEAPVTPTARTAAAPGRGAGRLSPALLQRFSALAPNVTATLTDAIVVGGGDGEANPGDRIRYTLTVTNSGPDPATGVTITLPVDPNTTLVAGSQQTSPLAFTDAYTVVGNVRIQPNAAQGVLANDIDPDTGNNTGLTASGPTTGPANGQATVNADG
ncbi:MAG TPA: hypothetical protein VD962_01030, partial [Rubricoccaceae bacterium]|nr:hypothetical protein [Rubricoccaceae bacterium]